MDDTLTSKLLKVNNFYCYFLFFDVILVFQVLDVKLFNRLMNFVAKSIGLDECCTDQMKIVISRFESESYPLTNKSNNNHARSKSMQDNVESFSSVVKVKR